MSWVLSQDVLLLSLWAAATLFHIAKVWRCRRESPSRRERLGYMLAIGLLLATGVPILYRVFVLRPRINQLREPLDELGKRLYENALCREEPRRQCGDARSN